MGVVQPLWLDHEGLVSEFGRSEQHLGKVLRAFLQESPRTLAALAGVIAQGDAERTEVLAQQLAMELARLHARPVALIARQIEHAAAAGRVHGVPPLLARLDSAMHELLAALVPLAGGVQRRALVSAR